MDDPITELAPNKNNAMSVFKAQLKKLGKCEIDKMDVINSENKLQELDHVDYVKNLPLNIQFWENEPSKLNHDVPTQSDS